MGYQQDQKKKNTEKILEIIHRTQGISRIDIARELEIDRSTVTSIVPSLLEKGILTEIQLKPTGKGGRPPLLLQINKDFGYTIGMELHLGKYHAALLNLNGEIVSVYHGALPHEIFELGLNCKSILHHLEKQIVHSGIPIIGAVIAISGTIDPINNTIDSSFVFQMEKYDFQKQISNHFTYPVFVENDANACAWGELFPPWNRKHSSFLYLLARTTSYNMDQHIDTGMAIGIGVVANGYILYGSHNQAGELRSVFWKQTEGSRNQVSIPLKRLAKIHQDNGILKEFVEEILVTLSPVVSVIDPEAIIFGGDLKNDLPVIKEILDGSLSENYLASEQNKYSLDTPEKGDEEICAGAACMFLNRLFKQNYEHPLRKDMIAWDRIFQLV
ncbi:MAG: ROK family transcriptional regulator [Spirochaetaceae bacterium]|jgi:predicted NBD/HSP70 family sugar kinase|nr:ROK family transcriptional regulator [Spirochaetaceae bacterium]